MCYNHHLNKNSQFKTANIQITCTNELPNSSIFETMLLAYLFLNYFLSLYILSFSLACFHFPYTYCVVVVVSVAGLVTYSYISDGIGLGEPVEPLGLFLLYLLYRLSST